MRWHPGAPLATRFDLKPDFYPNLLRFEHGVKMRGFSVSGAPPCR